MVSRKIISELNRDDSINISYSVCKNGVDPLKLLKSCAEKDKTIDLLVSDIEMPGFRRLGVSIRSAK